MATFTRPVALVTGASVGIGKAFAEELARRGHDLVLVARSADQLEALAANLRKQHSLEVEVLAADLCVRDDLDRVAARLTDEHRPIDLLVNNAGRGANEPFASSPLADHLAQIDLNITALVTLSSAALGPMVARDSGGLLNVASIAAFQPVVNEAVYAATKSFVLSLTEAIHAELHGTGVKVTALCPGMTRSEFQQRAGIETSSLPSFVWQEADEVAAAGLNALEAGRAVCVPGLLNKALGVGNKVTPRPVVRRISALVGNRLR